MTTKLPIRLGYARGLLPQLPSRYDLCQKSKTILITGASSGLGRALAIQYANKGVCLILFARSELRIREVADICKKRQAEIVEVICDVKDTILTATYMEKFCNNYNIDIIITSAGVSAGTLNHPESTMQIKEIFSTNLNGSLNIILPALPMMIKRKYGTIVLISSMAGLLPLASAPSYSASKAAIKTFGEAMRSYLKRFHVQICVVVPGYIDTPMTQVNKFPMPFKISAEQAAKIIIKGISNKKGLIVFPKIMYFILKIISLLPYPLLDYINSKLPGKPSINGE